MSSSTTPTNPTGPPPPILSRPATLVSDRTLAAEACAASALALLQQPALWSALHTVSLMQEAAEEYERPDPLGAALADLLTGAMLTGPETTRALDLLETLDRTARNWAALAFPGARPGQATVPMLGVVT